MTDTRTRTVPPIPLLETTPQAPQLPALVATEPSLSDLTAMIQNSHQEAMGAFARGAYFAIRAGHALIAAKKKCGHGLWEDYVTVDCRLTKKTAQNYMKMAKQEAKLAELVADKRNGISSLSQNAALKLLSMASPKRRRGK